MKKAILAAMLLVAGAGCTSWRSIFIDREKLKIHVQNAQRNYHAGQYERAVHQAKKALDIDDAHPKALSILGFCFLQVVRTAEKREDRLAYCEKAEGNFLRAIQEGSETDPAVFKAYFGLGLIYFLWAQEVESMMEASGRKEGPLHLPGEDTETQETLWSE